MLEWTPSGSRALPEIASETTSVDVWAAAEDDVWVLARDAYPFECRPGEPCPVHDDILAHFDGQAWSSTRLPGAPLFAITGSASDRVVAVGDGGAVVELTGGVWLQSSVGSDDRLVEVVARGNELWALASEPPAIWRRSALSSWSRIPVDGMDVAFDLALDGETAIVLGRDAEGTVVTTLSGSSWSEVLLERGNVGADGGALAEVDGELVVVRPHRGHHVERLRAGSVETWYHRDDVGFIMSFWATSIADVVAVGGAFPTVARLEGDAWRVQWRGEDVDLSDVWFADAAQAWVTATGGPMGKPSLYRVTASAMDPVDLPDPAFLSLEAIWGNARTEVWAVGHQALACPEDDCGPGAPSPRARVLRYDGVAWSDMSPPGVVSISKAVHGAMGHVVVGGERFVATFDGTSWRDITPGDAWYESVWMRAPGDVWVAGDGVLMHHDGSVWTAIDTPGQTWRWIDSGWAAGFSGPGSSRGVVAHLDGATWKEIAVPDGFGLGSIRATADGVLVAGDSLWTYSCP